MKNNKDEIKNSLPTMDDFDKIIHEPARLLILSILYVLESADFVFIKNQTKLTDGNLSSHLSKLEVVEFIDAQKKFIGKKPITILKLSQKGRSAFEKYKKKMVYFLNSLNRR